MKKIDLGQMISILANVGVIGGLIFVGMQLRQDRDLAAIERRHLTSESNKQWAELVTANADLWVKGIAGQPLTSSESVRFDVLAKTLEYDLWRNWENSRSRAFGIGADMDRSRLRESFIRETALEVYSNPGLLDWYTKNGEWLQRVGRYGEFEELVFEEINRLRRDDKSN